MAMVGNVAMAQTSTDDSDTLAKARFLYFDDQTFNGSIGGSDINDYFEFTTNGQGSFMLSLTGLSRDIDLSLLDYRGMELLSASGDGAHDKTIAYAFTDNQLYYVRVYTSEDIESNYSLGLAVTESTPMPADLSVTDVRLDMASIEEGGSTSIQCTLSNSGETAAYDSRLGVYYSTDMIYSGDDVLLEEATLLVASGEASSISEALEGLASLSAGTYYLFVVADYADDSNNGNNISDPVMLVITELATPATPADLSVTDVRLDMASIEEGGSTSIQCTLSNSGETAAYDSRLGVYYSTDMIYSGDDVLLEEATLLVASGEASSISEALEGLASLSAGTYYLFVVADYADDSNNGNNISDPVMLVITEPATPATPADLSVTDVRLDMASIEEGGSTSIQCTLSNSGETAAYDSRLGVYYSTDMIYSGDDVLLEEATLLVASGEASSISEALEGLASLSAGTYYLFVVADYADDSNNGNNVSDPVMLVITEPLIVNSPPNNLVLDRVRGFYLDADTPYGTLIGQLSAIDAEGDSLSYESAGMSANSRFFTVFSDGEVTRSSIAFGDESEMASSYVLEVIVSDGTNAPVLSVTIPGRIDGNQGTDIAEKIVSGDDSNQVHAGGGDDHIKSGGGNDIILAGDGDDVVIDGRGSSELYGENGHDRLLTGSGNNVLSGGLGNDFLIGGIGQDTLDGGEGQDIISGDHGYFYGGSDTITGGAGDDLLMGGRAGDTFVFRPGEGADIIARFDIASVTYGSDAVGYVYDADDLSADFTPGKDKIRLEGFAPEVLANVMAYFVPDPSGSGMPFFSAEGTSIVFYGVSESEIFASDFE